MCVCDTQTSSIGPARRHILHLVNKSLLWWEILWIMSALQDRDMNFMDDDGMDFMDDDSMDVTLEIDDVSCAICLCNLAG